MLKLPVLRTSKRDWEYRERSSTQQHTYPGINCYQESPSDNSPSNSLPTPPPPPLVAPPPPPPPPRRPRRNVTFAESPPKSPKRKSPKFIFQRKLSSIAALDVAVPWTPASPRHWSGLNDKPEYIT
ncbi:PREDICTED: WAS/WASL-interacting protein family member 3 [Cyphomyrmex costatus]|uniref:WAS/WASL-interacting protein family member 3 n=1 Tax=Cyphomyrmex costatus TaxID=456900 RepID=UPI0008522D8A|nr:PREDICTED: WAS/WASL-interacting protein family member 3 [Cyphomyrmex costatus]